MPNIYGKTKRGRQNYDSVYNEAYHQYKLFYMLYHGQHNFTVYNNVAYYFITNKTWSSGKNVDISGSDIKYGNEAEHIFYFKLHILKNSEKEEQLWAWAVFDL
jgi:predicted nucleotidyltransferase